MTYVPATLKRQVYQRASGCCEYCLVHQDDYDIRFHIEHIIAIAQGGKTIYENLCLSCPRCNLYKGTNIAGADPVTGAPTFIFHPRLHNWTEHFQIKDEFIEPLTPEGRVTTFLLRLNQEERLEERRLFIALERYPCREEQP
jgi:hypothetical protein